MSYDPTLPTTRDRVRLAMGDTNEKAELLEDITYDALIAALGETEATAALAEGLAARYGQTPRQVRLDSGLTVNWGDRVSTWLELAKRMRGAGEASSSASALVRVRRPEECSSAEYTVERVCEPWWTG